MMKRVRIKKQMNWVEIAHARLISPKRSPSCSKLETILEEGCYEKSHEIWISNKIFLVVPLLISMVFLFLVMQRTLNF
ncbi:hypothetical protein ERO13_A06G196300v2 [Gossypium hirsutum]|nr:hypothetical protein ERO13_A06G196300v2 [Gossypium hirsutum]